MNPSKAKGNAWEHKITLYLRERGARYAERRRGTGVLDRGDIAGIPGIVIEAKCAARQALAEWLDEAEAERVNDGAALTAVWHHRRGRGSPGAAYVTMCGRDFVTLLIEAGYIAVDAGGAA